MFRIRIYVSPRLKEGKSELCRRRKEEEKKEEGKKTSIRTF